MKRVHLLAALAAAVLAAPCAPAAAAAGTRSAQLTGFSCQRAVQPLLRGLSVEAVMRPIPATRQLQMKAQLLTARSRHGRYRVVRAPRLGRWFSPGDPTLGQEPADVWRVGFPVVGLPAPAFYRLRVYFRWLELNRRMLATEVLTTPVCHQLELRPDLVAWALAAYPSSTQPGQDRYVAVVRNRGLTGAGPFAAELDGPSGPIGSQTVSWLGPRSRRRVVFLAPACTPGTSLTLTVDPAEQTLDFNRANNTLSIACPPA